MKMWSRSRSRHHPRGPLEGAALLASRARATIATLLLIAGTASGAAAPATASSEERLSLYHPGVITYYAFVEAPVAVRASPSSAARIVQRLGTSTADGTSMVVEAIEERGTAGQQWLQIHMPVLPNSRTGWVPRSELSQLIPVRTWLVINTEHLTATLIASGRTVFKAVIGDVKSSTPTPHGNFYVIDRLDDLAFGGLYGPLAFGTSAKSPVLTDWPGGGVVGIHGTNEPQLIPGHPSHGCVRMRNRDILRLGRLMPVGTPVTIE